MRPLDIEILLSVYVSGLLPERLRDRARFRHVHETLNNLENEGLIRSTARINVDGHQEFESTDRLVVYMNALTSLPLPVKKWVMPDGERP